MQTARNYGGAIILGIHSFDKLLGAGLRRGKCPQPVLAGAHQTDPRCRRPRHRRRQCARYIGNREIRQMDEGYSYGYNSTRDASTLTRAPRSRRWSSPTTSPTFPPCTGTSSSPEGFPAARIRLEWQHYPRVSPTAS
ncbi:type IV secretion system DNA-binding domain-containing protein [Sphingomonas panni]